MPRENVPQKTLSFLSLSRFRDQWSDIEQSPMSYLTSQSSVHPTVHCHLYFRVSMCIASPRMTKRPRGDTERETSEIVHMA